MKLLKFLTSMIVAFAFMFLLTSIMKAETNTIKVNGVSTKVNGIYTYQFSKSFSASTVVIKYADITKTFTSTTLLIDISEFTITSTEELTITGEVNTITMIESDDPENPFIIFSSIENLEFHWNKKYYSNFLPMIQTSKT